MIKALYISKGDTSLKWDFLVYIALFILLNPVTTFGVSDMVMLYCGFLLAFYLFILKKRKVDMIFIYVVIYWCAVNLLSVLFLSESGTTFKLSTFAGSLIKLFLGYGIMKLCGIRFIVWFYRITLVLAVISIPLFIVQLVQPSLFDLIPFNFVAEGRAAEGHWNGFFFNYSTFHLVRNSGFGGEPGTFGYYLGLSMIFNLILHNGQFNRNLLILALVGLTTFSTNFYLTLVVFGLYFLSSANWTTKIFYLVFCLLFASMAYQLPFVGEKIDTYVEDTESMAASEIVRSRRVNRMATFVNHMQDVAKFPIGYGVNEAGRTKNVYGNVIDGTNGFSRIALRFGIFGVIYFVVVYFKLFDKLTLGNRGTTLFTLIVFMYIAANPMERDYFAMALFWLHFLIEEKDVQRLVSDWNTNPQENIVMST